VNCSIVSLITLTGCRIADLDRIRGSILTNDQKPYACSAVALALESSTNDVSSIRTGDAMATGQLRRPLSTCRRPTALGASFRFQSADGALETSPRTASRLP
jgi:hypothetical protein